ncbi:MAG: UDP-N-acetylmuramate--L-alanine ligase [Omnitrophica bacterium]|nr:UDP-N-acetylmuramate--L-alanine ligase [Candidatus Omnitrophota bacterium]
MFLSKNKVHFVGIGGIGMSGIAQLLLAEGLKVSGSDLKPSQLTEKLKRLGAKISIGHSADNLTDADLLIYTSAIKKDNPELLAAYSRGIAVASRAQALAELANQKNAITVTGAHGKTTTSSLISHLLIKSGLKPTVCIGGELVSLSGNAFRGKGHYFVLEADESDASFLTLNPLYSVVTNIDREHLDYYRDLDHIIETFRKFMDQTRDEGCLIFCEDDLELVKIARSLKKRLFSFGLTDKADIFAKDLRIQNSLTRFNCVYRSEDLGEIILQVPGRHNASNALAAIAVGLKLKLRFNSIQEALGSYQGVRRRLELKLKQKDILVFEDYAHHPTEIKATLEALKNFHHKRLVAVFQPHRYSRTKCLIEQFGSCFHHADQLIVTDIYAASEEPIEGVSAKSICQKAQEAKVKDVRFLPKEDIVNHLLKQMQPGDLVAIMGAGDIGSVANALVERLKGSHTL